ncbi:glycosyltransferase family 15 protein [Mycena latifolia]|nr:glycosyltransferase family 15 protein [Mycena latifolia]
MYYLNVLTHEDVTDAEALDCPTDIPGFKFWQEPPYKTAIPDSNLPGVVSSMTQLEDKFNGKFGYPYAFLNEEPFTEEFKRTISALTTASVQFGLIPPEHWYQPLWIDEEKASVARNRMGKVPYRNMCRFQSGFFFRHELLKPFKYFKYYWRPDVKFFCDVDFDPFLFIEGEDKKYAFTLALHEYKKTIRSLWRHVKGFMDANPELISPDNALGMLVDRTRTYYDRCHFWSSFEIADMELWRSEPYRRFFEYLDSKSGFYYDRWGDAPVHTLGAALFTRKDQIHFLDEMGYAHVPFEHCPAGPAHARGKCECDVARSFDHRADSCLRQYDELFGYVPQTVLAG